MKLPALRPEIVLVAVLGGAAVLAIVVEGIIMGDGNDVVTTITRRLDWPAATSTIKQMKLEGLEDCEIYDARDERAPNSASVGVIKLKDGSLIVGSEPGALNAVFAKCVSPATPTGTMAELLVSFSHSAGLKVLHDNSPGIVRDLLDKAGQSFKAPEAVEDQGGRIIRFFALSLDGSILYRVEGHVGNEITIDAKPL